MDFSEANKEMAKRILKQYCTSWNEIRYDEIRNKPYFIGKRSKDSTTEVLCPINCNRILTYEELKALVVDSGSSSVNLAIYSSDSTVVLYKAEMGLKPPDFLKDARNNLMSENSDCLIQLPGSSKKRKLNSEAGSAVSNTVHPEQSETCSTTDCLQIDLQPSVDSELSGTDRDASEDSDFGSGD